jgi:hypothetical protein
MVFFDRWISAVKKLDPFYNSKMMKKRRFDLKRALKSQLDMGVQALLRMAGKRMDEVSDGSVVFSCGDCFVDSGDIVGYYSAFVRYFIKKVRQLGYKVIFEDEFHTSQKFPMLGYQVKGTGRNRIRIKYCSELSVYIHRDIMAGENMADILVAKIKGLLRPTYLQRNMKFNASSQLVKK